MALRGRLFGGAQMGQKSMTMRMARSVLFTVYPVFIMARARSLCSRRVLSPAGHRFFCDSWRMSILTFSLFSSSQELKTILFHSVRAVAGDAGGGVDVVPHCEPRASRGRKWRLFTLFWWTPQISLCIKILMG